MLEQVNNRLQEGRLLDYTIVFLLVKRLLTPIDKWDAYTLGIINSKGEKVREPRTSKEKDSYTLLDKLVLKLKSLIGDHKLRLLTAYLLLRDSTEVILSDTELVEHFRKRNEAREIYKELQGALSEAKMTFEEFWNVLLGDVLR